MMERFLRAHGPQLQVVYDAMPSPARTLLTSIRGSVLAKNRYSHSMYELERELRSHDSWNEQDVADYQRQALHRIIEYGREAVPFYANYPKVAFENVGELSQLPILTRDVVRENFQNLVARNGGRDERIVVSTTGTTGANLKVSYSTKAARQSWAFRMRQWAWAGVRPRVPRLTFFGSRVVPAERRVPPYWTHNFLERQVLLSIFHLSAESAPDYIAFMRRHRGKVLEGFPSTLGIMADLILKVGDPIPMRVVFTDGEPLYPFLRQKIEQAFNTRVFDSYGNTELCGLIQECESGQMHLAPEYAFLEILDENNEPTKDGEEGDLVWTGFINEIMPLIRYRIGDRGCWHRHQCACGRAFPIVVPTITRESDLLRCPDGRIFSPRALNQLLKRATAFRFCQFVQEKSWSVVVRGVPSHGYGHGNAIAQQELAAIKEQLQQLLGKEVQVSTQLAEEAIVRRGGKMPLIVQPAHVQNQ